MQLSGHTITASFRVRFRRTRTPFDDPFPTGPTRRAEAAPDRSCADRRGRQAGCSNPRTAPEPARRHKGRSGSPLRAVHPNALVLAPSVAAAGLVAVRLRRAGVPVAVVPRDWAAAAAGGCVVVGARAAAWAPCPG